MTKRVFTVGITLFALFSLALPVAAAQPAPTRTTVDDGACLAAIRPLPSGVYQVWIYCYGEGGYYPAGTAMHLVAAPTDHPAASAWGEPVDLTPLPGDILDGTYYVKENAVSPVAVAAKTGRWDALPNWLFRNRLRLRDQSQLSEGTSGIHQETQTRLQNQERSQEEAGQGTGQTERDRVRTETQEHTATGGSVNSPGLGLAQGQTPNGHAKGMAQGRR